MKCIQENQNSEVYFKSIFPVTKTEIYNVMFAIANRTFTRQDHFTRHIQLCTTDDQIVPSFVEEHKVPYFTFLIQ